MITRTMTKYEVEAYDITENDEGVPQIETLAACKVMATSMTKGAARAALAESTGAPVSRGVTITWKPVQRITYGMDDSVFLDQAIEIKSENIA